MDNAKKQSVDLEKNIEDFKGMAKAGVSATAKEAVNVLVIQVGFGLIIFFFILFSRACNN